MARARLDLLLVERGLFATREQSRRAIMAGQIEVDGHRLDKPGTPVGPEVAIRMIGEREPFVSRGGRKLAAALDAFGIDVAGRVALDVGASTGGFTDCLLQRGASRVYAVDVGYGQLDRRLREDPRVVVRERVNARHLDREIVPEPVSVVVIDVSFISLRLIVPALDQVVDPAADVVALIKPQFEAGRGQVGKGGVIRDQELRRAVIDRTVAELGAIGWAARGLIDSPIAGARGNVEALVHLRREAA
jgi:23S rRNA (cytidine1920-2'-O)/16S rRNA (cytidine1409-2'-O)-methyltransferase